jgi:hypothetical protein
MKESINNRELVAPDYDVDLLLLLSRSYSTEIIAPSTSFYGTPSQLPAMGMSPGMPNANETSE